MYYGYQEHLDISPEQIFQKVSQEQIFEHVLRKPFDFSERYISPLRSDRKPGCRFEQREDGIIVFVDFGEGKVNPEKTHRSAIGMIMDYYRLGLVGAIIKICTIFGLSANAQDYQPLQNTYISSKEKPPSTSALSITPVETSLTKNNKIFWSQFTIMPEHLKQDNVYACSGFIVNKATGRKTINIYKHGYVFDFIDAVKIYQPYSEKYKFITNCNENHIGNFDNLPPTGKHLIIKKSYKDHRVLRNCGMDLDNVIWFQNEGCVPDHSILYNLSQRFDYISSFYDNDEGGVVAARKISNIFNQFRPNSSRAIWLPQVDKHLTLHGRYLKDPGEFVSKEGKADLRQILTQIDIHGKDTFNYS